MSEPLSELDPDIARRLKRNADGLFTAVVQERGSGDVGGATEGN